MNLGLATIAICLTVILCAQGDPGRPSMRQAVTDYIAAQAAGCR